MQRVHAALALALALGVLMIGVVPAANACGTVNGCPDPEFCKPSAPGVMKVAQEFGIAALRPVIDSAPAVDPGTGNNWWVIGFTVWDEVKCIFGPGTAGFRTVPMDINGPGESMNGCACGITLPAGTTLHALTFLPGGSSPAPSCDPAAWSTANSPSTGMAPFSAASADVAGQIVTQQGPLTQAFVSPGPYTINDSFFDVWILVEAPPEISQAAFERNGSLGLFGIDDVDGAGANVFPESNPNDFCTQGEPQIIPFSGAGPVATESTTWGRLKSFYE